MLKYSKIFSIVMHMLYKRTYLVIFNLSILFVENFNTF